MGCKGGTPAHLGGEWGGKREKLGEWFVKGAHLGDWSIKEGRGPGTRGVKGVGMSRG